MKNVMLITLASMGVAGVWGYFTDLSKGNIAGFISKIFFVSAFMFAMQFSIYRGKKKYAKNSTSTNSINTKGKSKKTNKKK